MVDSLDPNFKLGIAGKLFHEALCGTPAICVGEQMIEAEFEREVAGWPRGRPPLRGSSPGTRNRRRFPDPPRRRKDGRAVPAWQLGLHTDLREIGEDRVQVREEPHSTHTSRTPFTTHWVARSFSTRVQS